VHVDQTGHGARIAQGQAHAQVAAHGVADHRSAADAEHALQLAEPGGERLGVVGPVERAGGRAGAREIRHVQGEAAAERLEHVAPRVARGHEAVDEQERRARAEDAHVGGGAAELGCGDLDGARHALVVAVGAERQLGQIAEASLAEGHDDGHGAKAYYR
jgi:hypothetical protein